MTSLQPVRELDLGRDVPAPSIVSLDVFLARNEQPAVPLLGSAGETLLPAGGLLILGGEGGASKTTLTLDAIAHLASGTPWLGFPVERPLQVLIVENEGPRPQFREKLREKTETWAGRSWRERVHVWEEPWTGFSFASEECRRALREARARLELDLVAADPLDSLGIAGAGKPEETREFVAWLRECGLHDPEAPLAFWLLHHFAKAPQRSVVQQLSGAWGGHPDTVLGVELGDGQTTKLTWGKLRHATPPASRTTILAWDVATRGFAAIETEPGRLVKAPASEIAAFVRERGGVTPGEIRERFGIGDATLRERREALRELDIAYERSGKTSRYVPVYPAPADPAESRVRDGMAQPCGFYPAPADPAVEPPRVRKSVDLQGFSLPADPALPTGATPPAAGSPGGDVDDAELERLQAVYEATLREDS